MSDPVEQTYEDVRNHAKEYFGIADSESETLMRLAKRCAQTAGIPMAGAGAVALAGVGSVTIPLVGSVPGYIAGALAGFVGGTTACMIARGSQAGQVRQILSTSGSLSGILCARHSMTRRSMYAKQEDDEGGGGRGGEVSDHPQGAH